MSNFKRIFVFLLPILAFSRIATAAESLKAVGGDLGIPLIWWVAPISSVLALLFAIYFYKKMMSAPEGNAKMIEING